MKALAKEAVILALARRALDFILNDDEREARAMELARAILALRLDDQELAAFDVCKGVIDHRVAKFGLKLGSDAVVAMTARELASILKLGMLLN